MGQRPPARAGPNEAAPRLGLVLGAGGTVGVAYHAGVVHALEEEAGLRPQCADLMVGTSAGAVVAAYLRSGWSTSRLRRSLGRSEGQPDAGGGDPGDAWAGTCGGTSGAGGSQGWAASLEGLVSPAFSSPLGLVRRGIGSAFVMGRSLVRVPAPSLPPVLGRLFPGGMCRVDGSRGRLEHDLPGAWPPRRLWLCTLDIVSGRRVVLGRGGDPGVGLATAVRASCAVPGLYPPVRVGRQVLVDGAMHSSTNLDLVVAGGCGLVIAVAPMAFDQARPPGHLVRMLRRVPTGMLSHEAAAARSRGATVLLLRPTTAELRAHGVNPMRVAALEEVATAAYQSTARALATEQWRSGLSLVVA